MEKRIVSKKVTSKQKIMMVDYMEQNLDFANGRINTNETRQEIWNSLSEQLNAVGGAIKSMEQWKKCWLDLKLSTKDKAAKLKKRIEETGGLFQNYDNLSEVEKKIISIIAPYTLDGDILKTETNFQIFPPTSRIDLSKIEIASSTSIPSFRRSPTPKKRKIVNTPQSQTSQIYNNALTLDELVESNIKLIELNEKIIDIGLEKNQILKKQNKLMKARNKIEEEKLKLLKRKLNLADVEYID